MKLIKLLFVFSLLTAASATAQEKTEYTNLFCTTAEIRSDLYTTYEQDLTQFPNELATRLAAGDCFWKDYDADTELTILYPYNDELTMVSAVFDGVTLFTVTFSKYLGDDKVI